METLLEKPNKLQKYLGPFEAFALSIGCAIGWGTFVMPYTYFLPLSGTLGSLIGMVIGAILMIIIGYSYHYMMNKYPSSGGALTYTTKAFGRNHGFLCAWFLGLTYVAMLWANANAFKEDVKKALDAGMNGHISKPIDLDNLLAVLAKTLHKE